MKRKGLAVGIILLFIGTAIIPSSAQNVEKSSSASRGHWLYVGGSGPGNFTRIQDAINATSDGDTVFVYDDSSPYPGNIEIFSSIHLIGENKDTTVIGGVPSQDPIMGTILIDSFTNYANISGFTIEGIPLTLNGITIWGNHNTISGNIIRFHDLSGIDVDGHYNTISGNIISTCALCGVFLDSSGEHNKIINNSIEGCSYGVRSDSYSWVVAENNTISGNTITNNGDGIYLAYYTENNTIINNNIAHNSYGIVLGRTVKSNSIYHNNLMQNSVNNGYDYSMNDWYNADIHQGNYWSDYPGEDTDGDGIGDSPYTIPGGSSQDLYPIMKPNGWLPNFTFEITGGLGVTLKITNIGIGTLTDVSWQLHVEGGILGFINRTKNGTANVTTGETITVATLKVLGLGRVSITAKVADEIVTKTGVTILFFVIEVH